MTRPSTLFPALIVGAWLVWASFVFVAERLGFPNYSDVSRAVLANLEALLAVVAIIVMRQENRKDTKLLFLNFAAFFAVAGIVPPIYYHFFYEWAFTLTPYSNIFYYQYSEIAYFLLLTLCVVHLAACIGLRSGPYKKYLAAFLIACSIGFLCFFPFLQNPRYSDTTPDAIDYRAIKQVVDGHSGRIATIDLLSVVLSQVTLYDHESGSDKVELVGISKQRRVMQLLPLVLEKEFTAIYWKELHLRCAYAALICVAFLLFFACCSFIRGFPSGAYLEKISWILVPYCILELFHLHSYALVTTIGEFENLAAIGSYLTVFILVGLLLFFVMRWRFVSSIEGRYYEQTLGTNSGKVTRWRDAFDEWILRKYVNAEDLRRRFLIRRRSEESDDSSDSS